MNNPRIQTAIDAYNAGRITREEAEYFLRQECDTTLSEHLPPPAEKVPWTRNRVLATILLITLFISMGTYLYPTITGNIVLDIPQNTTNSTIIIDQNVTGLNITGMLYGDGTTSVYFDTDATTYLVGTVVSDIGVPRTHKPGYAAGEEIIIEHAPENATYYFDDGAASTAVTIPFNATVNGTLLIVTATDTYRVPIIVGETQRAVSFISLCAETCEIAPASGALRIETTGTAVLQLDRVDAAVLAPNTAPVLAAALPSPAIAGVTSIDLSQHFIDPDGDALYYSTSENAHVRAEVAESVLTLTPLQDGATALTIYVSDLQELVPFEMSITVAADSANGTNGTALNETPPVQPETPEANLTNATANATANGTLNCSGTDPNALPEECLLQNATEYFPDQDIFWENLDREQVARFTVIGNMLITGDIIEHSTATPGSRDFSIGYADRYGDVTKTIWISNDGSLHLRGALHEENANLQPAPGSYSVITKRSIYIAYADPQSGDLYIRGNVIPYRRSIT